MPDRSVAAGAAAKAALGLPGGRGAAKEWASVLQQVPLFAPLSRRDVRKIAALATVRRYERGVPIVAAGRAGDAFYVILDGQVSVGVPGRRAARLGRGDYFGEMALLDGAPRSATVTAASEVHVLQVGRAAFGRMLKQEPQISVALLKTLAGRLRSLERSTSG